MTAAPGPQQLPSWPDDKRVRVRKNKTTQRWEWEVGKDDGSIVGYLAGGNQPTHEEAVRIGCCVHAEVFGDARLYPPADDIGFVTVPVAGTAGLSVSLPGGGVASSIEVAYATAVTEPYPTSDNRDPENVRRWAVAAEVAARYFDAREDDQAYLDLRTDVHAALSGLIEPDAAAWRSVQ